MGYRIVYSKENRRLSKGAKTLITSILAGALLIGIGYLSRPKLPETALENMVDALRNGEPISDAITSFCREIIDNAQMPQ